MSEVSRRKLITGGIAAVAGVSGIAVAGKIAKAHGLIPPDSAGLYGPGETLTYAAQRILNHHAMAREFSGDEISANPFANEVAPLGDDFARMQAAGFADWKLTVDGMAARPTVFSYPEIVSFPKVSHTTMIGCEEGWTYIAEWTGVPLSYILDRVGAMPQARYIVYRSIQPDWWESMDMNDALHPQTVVATGMNGAHKLPVPFGGPLRMRVPRQLGYKSVKYLVHLTLTDSMKSFGKGTGGSASDGGYAWYAGI